MAFIKKIKKLKKSVKITGGVIIGVIVVFAIFSFYYRDKWYPNTSINGIDVSSMTYEESKNVLKNQIESYALEIGAEGNQKLTNLLIKILKPFPVLLFLRAPDVIQIISSNNNAIKTIIKIA